ncbi:MAG: TIGR04282 family arsenosugar biosynthesis glycosyltransferase, partial [bacterium]
DLARRMLEHTLHKALAANLGHVELCVTPSATDPVWQTLALPDAVQWSDQGEGDLGGKMARATQRVLESGESVLLVGTDCPELSSDHLRQAASALGQVDAALFPTFDGGYALLGLKRFHPSLFSNIAWSTESVAFETLHRMEQLSWTVQSQPMLHDIDEPADLQWLLKTWLEPAHA